MPRNSPQPSATGSDTVYWLPRGTAQILHSGTETDNFALALQRCVGTGEDGVFDQRRQKLVLDHLAELAARLAKERLGVSDIVEAYCDRVRRLAQNCAWYSELCGAVTWRMVVGLGRPGILEGSGMTVHPLYGFPYVPGSTVKGLCRTAALEETWEHHSGVISRSLRKASASLEAFDQALGRGALRDLTKADVIDSGARASVARLERVFGSQRQKGSVTFFDAVPEGFPKLDVDILNVHYPDYYQGDEPPSDWQDPRLVYFLAVSRGARFLFCVGARRAHNDDGECVVRWLTAALTEWGIGGKRSAGYGAFDIPNRPSQSNRLAT
jgi:CRISPR-associated protein Cmr6